MRLDGWSRRLVVVTVVVAWMTSLVASIFTAFEPPPTLNALFLALAGGALAIQGEEKGKGGDGSSL